MRKRWLLGRPRAPSAPPTRLRHQTRPSPSPSCGGALTPLLDRRVRDPFAARCHAAAAGFPSNCRNLNFYEPHRPPPPPPPNHHHHHHHHPQADAASTWCRCSGQFFGLEGRSFRSKMLWVKGGAGAGMGSKYAWSSLIYVVVWCSSRRSGRGLLCGRERKSFMSLLVWTQRRTT